MNDYWRNKKFLNSYRTAFEEYREIFIRKYDLEHPDVKALNVKPDLISGGVRTDLSDLFAQVEDIAEMYNGRLAVLREKMAAVRDAIENEENETCRKILSFRYIDFLNLKEIADIMGKSPAYIYQLHGEAVRRLKYKEVFDDG